MLLIYTGDGKGKTSACVGQAIRALGQELKVAFAQCMKQDKKAGEQQILHSLLGDLFYVGGLGFFRDKSQKEAHRQAALTTLAWAKEQLEHVDMLILDESLYALRAELITQVELTQLIELAAEKNAHLVLSGRGAPEWLIDMAHLVTQMHEIKHPWKQGIEASKGIEF